MTNEYALHLLSQLQIGASVDAKPIIPQYEFAQALGVAIKALEQQPSEPRTNLAETSRDCISRTELMQKLNAWDSKAHGIPNYAWKVIREMPSVTPERPKGKWIHKMQVMNNPYTNRCSVCKGWEKDKSKYCPNCGSYNGGNDNGDE